MLAFKYGGRASFLSLLVATLLFPIAASADELFVMPYACKVIRGQPTLTPSDDTGHPVIGRREQREFSACSPENPDLCRRWTVHRFDMDCGGVRVPWVEVAAAASRDGRAFVERGRFELEMPARWSLPPNAPCARRGNYDGWEFGKLGRFCEERLARIPRMTVAMPTGFAPMLGIDGIFVRDSGPPAMADARPVPPRRDFVPEPAVERPRSAEASDPIPEPIKKKPALKETPRVAAASPPAPVEATPPPKEPTPSRAPEPPKPEPAKTEVASAEKTEGGAGPIVPTIINGANVPEQSSQRRSNVSETGALPDRPEAQSALPSVEERSEVAGRGASHPDRVAMAEHDTDSGAAQPAPTAALGGLPLQVDAKAVTVGCLALLTLLTLMIVIRRGRSQAVSVLARDLSSVSLGKAAPSEGGGKGALTLVADPRGRDLSTPPTLSPSAPALLGDGMPQTREEALSVLGMGIAPDVNEAAIKKIIDGLRLSWHPDHARDDEDRAMRELRLKQINAAWDIISGERKS